MRIVLDNGYEEIHLNVPVEEDEGKYSARLSDRQYARVYALQKKSDYLLVRPYKACDFVKAKFGNWVGVDANLKWEM